MKTLLIYVKEDEPNLALRVIKDEDGWLHISKLGPSCDNIFFCKEEIEMVVGCKLVLHSERELSA